MAQVKCFCIHLLVFSFIHRLIRAVLSGKPVREEIYNIYTFLSTEMRNEAWKFCNFRGCQG